MRIVFFGTPEFAVPSLRAVVDAGHDVAAVVTRPDRPRGRHHSTTLPSPVKALAAELGIPVLQPVKPVGDLFEETLRRLDPFAGVVVAYGHILQPSVLLIPPVGMLNVHASLLPRLRGAAPVQWAILNGDGETGVSIMRLEAGMDTGPVLHAVRTPVGPAETGGELARRLADLGAEALVEGLAMLTEGRAAFQPQDHRAATYAAKIDRDLCRIRWDEPADLCARRIRAFDPEPGAWTGLDGTVVKLFGPTARPDAPAAPPGTVLQAGDRISIAAAGGAVMVREVQPAGKRRMAVGDWVHGRGVREGDRFA